MLVFILASFGLAQIADYGDAQPKTLDPVEVFSKFTDLFKNCAYTAVQTFQLDSPNGRHIQSHIDVKCITCGDSIMIRSRLAMKSLVSADISQSLPDDRCIEKRWSKNGPRLDVLVWPERVRDWPSGSPATPHDVEAVFLHIKKDTNAQTIYSEVSLLQDIVGTVRGKGMTFSQMIIDKGTEGFTLKNVKWTSEDRSSSIRYDFESRSYGMRSVTFTKLADGWHPSIINITLGSNHKVVADSRLTTKELSDGANLLKNYPRLGGEFPEPYTGLDRSEATWEISYRDEIAGGQLLPRSIKLRDVAYLRTQQSVASTVLDLIEFRAGGVSCDEVRRSMIQIPDGCVVHVQNEKTAWTTKGGEVVPDVDGRALNLARGAKFSPRSKIPLFLWINGIALVAIIIWLYFRSRGDDMIKEVGS